MHPDALDARRLARNLASEIPEATHLPALARMLNTPSPTIPTTTSDGNISSLQSLLDLAAELILEPQQTLRVARATRPLLLDVVARALSGVRNNRPAAVGGVTPVQQAEVVLVVMSRLLPAAPHCLPLALDHWKSSMCPFECLRAAGLSSVDEGVYTVLERTKVVESGSARSSYVGTLRVVSCVVLVLAWYHEA